MKQTYKNIEIIVIDNFSNDKTREIAKQFGARVYLLPCERTKAKNIGTLLAKGKYILYLDSDMILSRNVIEKCVNTMENQPHIGGIIIPEISFGKSLLAHLRLYERICYFHTEMESARFYRRDLVLQAHGFDEDLLLYEEASLHEKVQKMGYKISRVPTPIIHLENTHLWPFLKKRLRYAVTLHRFIKRYHNRKAVADPTYRMKLIIRILKKLSTPIPIILLILLLKSIEQAAYYISILTSITNIKSQDSTYEIQTIIQDKTRKKQYLHDTQKRVPCRERFHSN